MRSLIDDLLRFSQVGSDDYILKQTDLNEVLKTAIDDLHISIDEKSAQINIGHLPTISGEHNKLYQVFLNLLSNGLKFSKPNQPPIINVTSQQIVRDKIQYWQITVQDNGIGFEQQYAEKIFEIFQRLHGRSQYQGTGIGLAICKRIVEKHNGKIYVESVLDKGTSFILLFEA